MKDHVFDPLLSGLEEKIGQLKPKLAKLNWKSQCKLIVQGLSLRLLQQI